MKSPDSSVQGGGAIYRVIDPDQIILANFDLDAVFSQALTRFTPLMRLLVPNRSEQIRLGDQEIVDNAALKFLSFLPQIWRMAAKKFCS